VNKNTKQIEEYCIQESTQTNEYLNKLERETNIKTINPRMLSGTIQGRILSMLSHLISPEKILEIGTFTAYASLCLAEGLVENGRLDTIEINNELEPIISKYIKMSPYENKIHVHFGDAIVILDELNGPYDLVFLDAKKEDYEKYYEKIIPKLSPGGLLLADNVLWSGKVLFKTDDLAAKAMQKFNKLVASDNRVENIILPIRDGLSLIRKVNS